MDGKAFLTQLNAEIEPLRQEVIHNPLHEAWIQGELSQDQVRQIITQYYTFLREVPVICAAWVHTAIKLGDPEVTRRYIGQLSEEWPHSQMLLDYAKETGHDPEEMRQAMPIPEWAAFHSYYYWLSTQSIIEVAAANNVASEGTVPRYFKPLREAAIKYYHATPALLEFLREHEGLDVEHTDLGAYVLEHHADTPEKQRKALVAAKTVLGIQRSAFKAMHRDFVAEDKSQP